MAFPAKITLGRFDVEHQGPANFTGSSIQKVDQLPSFLFLGRLD